jgi:hypothetical protein
MIFGGLAGNYLVTPEPSGLSAEDECANLNFQSLFQSMVPGDIHTLKSFSTTAS